jgi:5-methylthioadenosine/S-adenosylhomocysteine deaminase
MLRAGVTTTAEVMDLGTGWEAMREFGMQGVAYQEVFGPADAVAEDAMRALKEKIARYRKQESEFLRVGVSPHAPYTVSKTLFEKTRDYCRNEKLRMTAHIAESREETQFVRDGAGPFAEAHRKRQIAVTKRACLPVAYLDSLGLLGPDMLLIHAIETGDDDLRRIRETGSFVAHCPRSNAKLGHGQARVKEMAAQGIVVGLGTDSIASNDSIDMFEEMRMVSRRGVDAASVFEMATVNGARALGLSDRVGTLEPGKRADFAVVELHGDVASPLDAMLRRSTCADLKAVFIGGREVSLDDSALRSEAARIRQRLLRALAP